MESLAPPPPRAETHVGIDPPTRNGGRCAATPPPSGVAVVLRTGLWSLRLRGCGRRRECSEDDLVCRDENPARSQGGNMIDLDRPTPTAGLAFSTPFLYSLQKPRSGRPVRSDARSNLFPGLHAGSARSGAVSKRNC